MPSRMPRDPRVPAGRVAGRDRRALPTRCWAAFPRYRAGRSAPSWLTPVAKTNSSAVSPRSRPLTTLPSVVATATGSKLRRTFSSGAGGDLFQDSRDNLHFVDKNNLCLPLRPKSRVRSPYCPNPASSNQSVATARGRKNRNRRQYPPRTRCGNDVREPRPLPGGPFPTQRRRGHERRRSIRQVFVARTKRDAAAQIIDRQVRQAPQAADAQNHHLHVPPETSPVRQRLRVGRDKEEPGACAIPACRCSSAG